MIRPSTIQILFDRNDKLVGLNSTPYPTLDPSFYARAIGILTRIELHHSQNVEIVVVDDPPLTIALQREITKSPTVNTIRIIEIRSKNACESYLETVVRNRPVHH
jgi:hypothetical protein